MSSDNQKIKVLGDFLKSRSGTDQAGSCQHCRSLWNKKDAGITQGRGCASCGGKHHLVYLAGTRQGRHRLKRSDR